MKTKALIYTSAIVTLLTVLLIRHESNLSGIPKSTVTTLTQVNVAVRTVGGADVVGKEAARAIQNMEKVKDESSTDVTNCPAIVRMASLLEGEVLGIWPDGTSGQGIPAHIRIRFGEHMDYKFVMIFGAGSTLPSNSPGLKLIGGSIYLRDTSMKGS